MADFLVDVGSTVYTSTSRGSKHDTLHFPSEQFVAQSKSWIKHVHWFLFNRKNIRNWCWIIIGFRDKSLCTYLSLRVGEGGRRVDSHLAVGFNSWGYLDVRLTIDRDVEGCKDINSVSGECWKAPPVVGGTPGGICRNLPWPLKGCWICARCPGVKWNRSETKYIFRSGLVQFMKPVCGDQGISQL